MTRAIRIAYPFVVGLVVAALAAVSGCKSAPSAPQLSDLAAGVARLRPLAAGLCAAAEPREANACALLARDLSDAAAGVAVARASGSRADLAAAAAQVALAGADVQKLLEMRTAPRADADAGL